MLSNTELDQAVAACPGERVTADGIKARIASTEFMALPNSTVTICNITLDNGYSVRGESACVDPTNFNQEIGERYAYDDAFRKLWPLFGFLMAERRSKAPRGETAGGVLGAGTLMTTGSAWPGVMNFGQAIAVLKAGQRVARSGWNGKGMWLSLSCDGSREIPAENFWSPHNAEFARQNGGKATVLPSITMKTATGEILMGWLASQSDMLAEDWQVVE